MTGGYEKREWEGKQRGRTMRGDKVEDRKGWRRMWTKGERERDGGKNVNSGNG